MRGHTQYKSLMDDAKWVEVNGRPRLIEPGQYVDFPDDWLADRYMQVGDFGEVPQWELVTTKDKAAKAVSETEEK